MELEREKARPEMAREREQARAEVQPVRGWSKTKLGLAVAGVIALGALIGGAAGLGIINGSHSDTLTQQQVAQRAAAYQAAISSGPIMLQPVPADQVDKEIAKLKLAPEQQQQLAKDVQGGQTRLVYLGLLDDASEDGDVVTVSANGLSFTVSLLNNPSFVAIPVSSNSGSVTLHGDVDGGGGITVGLVVGGKPIPLPPMVPGESRQIPIK